MGGDSYEYVTDRLYGFISIREIPLVRFLLSKRDRGAFRVSAFARAVLWFGGVGYASGHEIRALEDGAAGVAWR